MLLSCINISITSLIILAVAVKHPIYTEKSNISFEKYEPNDDNDCSSNCCSRSINDGVTKIRGVAWSGLGVIAAGGGLAVVGGSGGECGGGGGGCGGFGGCGFGC